MICCPLPLHHHPSSIASCVGDGSDLGARVRYSWEQPVLGSAGGPRHALPLLVDPGPGAERRPPSAGTFLLVNGDTLTDVDISALLDHHNRSNALVTMALIPMSEKIIMNAASPIAYEKAPQLSGPKTRAAIAACK